MTVPNNKTEMPLAHYRGLLAQSDPEMLTQKTGVSYNRDAKKWQIKVMGRLFFVSWPDGLISALPPLKRAEDGTLEPVADVITGPSLTIKGYASKDPLSATDALTILLLRMVLETTLAPHTGDFLSYQQICPAYMPAFNRRVTSRLAKLYESAQDFARACETVGGVAFDSKADASYEFEFVPSVFVRVSFWEGDDEFPAQAQILYSTNVKVVFSAEDLTVIGEIIVSALQYGFVR